MGISRYIFFTRVVLWKCWLTILLVSFGLVWISLLVGFFLWDILIVKERMTSCIFRRFHRVTHLQTIVVILYMCSVFCSEKKKCTKCAITFSATDPLENATYSFFHYVEVTFKYESLCLEFNMGKSIFPTSYSQVHRCCVHSPHQISELALLSLGKQLHVAGYNQVDKVTVWAPKMSITPSPFHHISRYPFCSIEFKGLTS